eukprot:scaffold5483_cov127-Isochrysis_galbana.AAC.4
MEILTFVGTRGLFTTICTCAALACAPIGFGRPSDDPLECNSNVLDKAARNAVLSPHVVAAMLETVKGGDNAPEWSSCEVSGS